MTLQTSWINFSNYQFFCTLENVKNDLKTFFHCTWNFFLLTVKSENVCKNILSKSKMFLHIFKLFIRCFVPIKIQNCHGWKKTAFFSTRHTMKIIIRQNLFRLIPVLLSCLTLVWRAIFAPRWKKKNFVIKFNYQWWWLWLFCMWSHSY